ncbi:MAG: zinc-dependent metalloprotease [Saprospiraceae bacterium]|nr:zinc-dependent metalloprotease [Saprospiraceae bacterium]
MRSHWLTLTVLILFSLTLTPGNAQIFKKKTPVPPPDTIKQEAPKKKPGKFKPYREIIPEEAVSDSGLIMVHQVDDKSYFELPFDLLEKEILIVSRISGYVNNLSFGGAGMKSRPQQVIRWQRLGDQVLLRSVSYTNVADPDNPVYESVRNNNFEPVIMTFPIKTFNADSTHLVIDVTDLFTSDVEMIGPLSKNQRKNFEIQNLDSKRSFVQSMRAFPQNVQIKHVLTYRGRDLPDNELTQTLSVEMTQSFILLPDKPMQPRFYDSRVAYFSVTRNNYSLDEQKAAKERFITRWRLEPKDPEAYARGELVEPVKPIVYYIDPATPQEWRPYIKQGVNDWQKAFEKAGFKNAIMAKDAPTQAEDPDWSPEDVRYSVIRYITTEIQNAQGPHVHDPRTGEILESDILWYHNVMQLLRNWYLVQTAAVNPDAQKIKFDREVMGQLIRFVASHEVGHTLGLPHNMGSSVAYKVDSLRSPTFTKTHGTAPSIMDYARFNYVAQPGDGVTRFYPGIGPYDNWAITYGYRLIPGQSKDAERATLNQWVREKAGNPIYRFGHVNGVDPSSQTEDIGDDPVYASDMGLNNLKRIVPHLIEWSSEEGEEFEELEELYSSVIGQFRRYIGHVTMNVGGVYEFRKTADEDAPVYLQVPKTRQEAAVNWLNQNVFLTPGWLLVPEILERIDPVGTMERIRTLQLRSLQSLYNPDRLLRLMEQKALYPVSAYTLQDLMAATRSGIWNELDNTQTPDAFRRNLQRGYLDILEELITSKEDKIRQSDIPAVVRAQLNSLQADVEAAIGRSNGLADKKIHLEDVLARINRILNPEDK